MQKITHIEQLMIRWWQTGIDDEAATFPHWGQIANWFYGASAALRGFDGDDSDDLAWLAKVARQREIAAFRERATA